MKLFIPTNGTKIKILDDLKIQVYSTTNLWQRANPGRSDRDPVTNYGFYEEVTIPKDSIIKFVKIDMSPYKRLATSTLNMTLLDSPDSRLVRRPKATPSFKIQIEELNKQEIEFEIFNI